MVNLETFEMTLKTKWMKQILARDSDWMTIPKMYGIDKIPLYGSDYLKLLLQEVMNPFWRSFIKAFTKFNNIMEENHPQDNILYQPIWYNPMTNIKYVKTWDKAGIRIVRDLINSDKEIKSKEEILTDFHISLNFIDYARLKKSIPPRWLLERDLWEMNSPLLWCQPHISLILSDSKSNQVIKKEFKQNDDWTSTAINSWTRDIAVNCDLLFWQKIFKIPFSIGFDAWMKMFQYKILHRILPTNKKLCQYGIKPSNICDYCNLEKESLIHIFCECDISACIWEEVINWYNTFGYNINYLSDIQILLGDQKLDPILNRIILTTKTLIFKNKSKRNRVTLTQLKASLLYQFDTEYFNARAGGRLRSFLGLWSPIMHEMQRMSKLQIVLVKYVYIVYLLK